MGGLSNRQIAIEHLDGTMRVHWKQGHFELARHLEELMTRFENMTDEEFEAVYNDIEDIG